MAIQHKHPLIEVTSPNKTECVSPKTTWHQDSFGVKFGADEHAKLGVGEQEHTHRWVTASVHEFTKHHTWRYAPPSAKETKEEAEEREAAEAQVKAEAEAKK